MTCLTPPSGRSISHQCRPRLRRARLASSSYRLTYCTRHGHYKVHDGRCLNCGTTVTSPAECRACRIQACEIEGNTAEPHTCTTSPGDPA